MEKALMKALLALLAVALLGAAFLSIHAQEKPAEYLLSTEEAKAWADLDTTETATARAFNEAVARAINTGVGAASIEIHGAISQAGLALELVRARRAAFLASLQARESCKGCVIEGGKLIPPKEPKK